MGSDGKFFVGVVFISLIALAALVFFGKSNTSADTITEKALAQGQKLGPDSAKVKIVEFSDFECPACALEFPLVQELQKDNSDSVQLIFVHFPLPSHKNSSTAASAAEAAGLQGKFWEMSGLLFDNQVQWSNLEDPSEVFISYAKKLDLNIERFTQDVNSVELEAEVDKDYELALDNNIDATPTFFVNGEKIELPQDASGWQKIIDEAKLK